MKVVDGGDSCNHDLAVGDLVHGKDAYAMVISIDEEHIDIVWLGSARISKRWHKTHFTYVKGEVTVSN